MYCNNCGKHNPEDSKFCQSCGAKMIKVSEGHKPENVKEHESVGSVKEASSAEAIIPSKVKKKGNYTHWIFWWILDKDALERQVKEYKNLSVWYASRKIAAIALLFSSLVTILMVTFTNYDSSALIDVALMLILAFFIYRGHRWALVLAMIYWTYAKFYGLYASYSITSTSHTSPIIAILWWAIYMHAFYEAFKVEQLRRKEEDVL